MRPGAARPPATALRCPAPWATADLPTATGRPPGCPCSSGGCWAGRWPPPKAVTSGCGSWWRCRSSRPTPSRRARSPPRRSCTCSCPSWACSRSTTSCRSAWSWSCCWRSSSPATGRRSSPTPTAAARTSSSRDNLGTNASLVAGASLMVDYTLTVAVSIAAGTAAILSAVAPLRDHRVAVAVGLTVLLALANLRGLRESGRLFAGPTYVYIVILGSLIVWGLVQYALGNISALPVDEALAGGVHRRRPAGRERVGVPGRRARSRRGRSPCRASRPSATASPPSARPSRATRRPRSPGRARSWPPCSSGWRC